MHTATTRTGRFAAVACVAAFLAAPALHPLPAQQPLVTVRGLAYDSLRAEPLGGAVIAVSGAARPTVTDRRGRFEIDSLLPGSHTFTMHHDALDSLGLTGVSARVEVTDGRSEIRLSVPSLATFFQDRMRAYPSTRQHPRLRGHPPGRQPDSRGQRER